MTIGRTDLVPIPRPYTNTEIPDKEDEFRIWPPKPRSIETDWDALDRWLLQKYKEQNPDAPIRDVDPPRPGNKMIRFDDPGRLRDLQTPLAQAAAARMPLAQALAARVPQPGDPAAPAGAAMSLPAWTWQAAGDRNPPPAPFSPYAQMTTGLVGRDRAPQAQIDYAAADPLQGRGPGAGPMSERLMDEDQRRQMLPRALMTPRLPTDIDWPVVRNSALRLADTLMPEYLR